MTSEFIRLKIPQYQKLTGILQIIGGLSLIIGYWLSNLLAFLGALGLALLMTLGFIIRIKVRDSILNSTPALLFACLNGFLAYNYYYS